jgi:competence protein ComEA
MNRTRNWIAIASIGMVLGLSADFAVAAETEKKSSAEKKPSSEAKKDSSKGTRLDLNTASLNDLKAIRGISEAQAKKIVEGRPYKRRNELLSKKIVDAETYEKLRERVYTKRADG